MWETLNRHAGIAAALVALFHARFDPENADERRARRQVGAHRGGAGGGRQPRRGPHHPPLPQRHRGDAADQFLPARRGRRAACRRLPSSSIRRGSRSCRRRGRSARSSSTARGSKASICASARWRAAASAGPTGRTISAPRCSASSRRSRSRTRSSCRSAPRAASCRSSCPPPATARRSSRKASAAYRVFISSLLDITDNLDGDDAVPPAEVVRHDGDDPYLVVAADKGTATFSDTANAIAEEHDFWLGDAFACGGSHGYDHKKMGITARGAWEAVKRHFREMDIDIQTTPFTVVGVGDMSGDVFGNGMLLSTQTRLVAAFDHRDIFIDPDPDPAASFAERQRLFALPRSSWQDYDRDTISPGGGVFSRGRSRSRSAPRCSALLGLAARQGDAATRSSAPSSRRAPTFSGSAASAPSCAAADEGPEKVGDRANDAIRITGGRAAGQGDRRGRQSRHDPDGADRIRPRRRPLQFRRDRQFGRGQHLRRRGQHQDRARPGHARRAARPEAARPPARRHDRRGGGAGACATTTCRRWPSRSPRAAASNISATSGG